MFWHRLPHRDFFNSIGKQISLEKGATLPVGKDAYYLQEGLAALTMLTASGDEKVSMYFKAGNIFGYFSYIVPDEQVEDSYLPINIKSIVAKTRISVRAIDFDVFFNAIEDDPLLYKDLSISQTQNLSNVLEHSYWLSCKDASTRLCLMMVNFMEEINGKYVIPRCFTYLEMGNFLSIHTVTIAKIIKRLIVMGVIKRHGHSIEILDVELLRQIAREETTLSY